MCGFFVEAKPLSFAEMLTLLSVQMQQLCFNC